MPCRPRATYTCYSDNHRIHTVHSTHNSADTHALTVSYTASYYGICTRITIKWKNNARKFSGQYVIQITIQG